MIPPSSMNKKTTATHSSLRKWLPLLLAAGVFGVVFGFSLYGFRYSFLQAENNSLFLYTPDYLQRVFQHSFPIFHLVRNFLLQFFHYPLFGPSLWGLMAALVCFLVLWPFRKRARLCTLVGSSLLLCAVVVCTIAVLNPDLRKKEQWNKLEYAALHHDWSLILSSVTPEQTARDPHLVPYVSLALTETGQLGSQLFHYAVTGPGCLDLGGWYSREGYFFNSVLYECMGCYNEAIHNTFQAAVYLPEGNSFGTLRQLIKFYYHEGRTKMARKYLAILRQSTIHRSWARKMLATLPHSEAAPAGKGEGGTMPAPVSNNLAVNLASLMDSGHFTPQNFDRLLTCFLLEGEMNAFVQLLDSHINPQAKLPVHYQEALLVAQAEWGIPTDKYPIDKAVRQKFELFLQTKLAHGDFQRFSNTYWAYYFNVSSGETAY